LSIPFVEERKTSLDLYIKELVNMPVLYTYKHFTDFLDPNQLYIRIQMQTVKLMNEVSTLQSSYDELQKKFQKSQSSLNTALDIIEKFQDRILNIEMKYQDVSNESFETRYSNDNNNISVSFNNDDDNSNTFPTNPIFCSSNPLTNLRNDSTGDRISCETDTLSLSYQSSQARTSYSNIDNNSILDNNTKLTLNINESSDMDSNSLPSPGYFVQRILSMDKRSINNRSINDEKSLYSGVYNNQISRNSLNDNNIIINGNKNKIEVSNFVANNVNPVQDTTWSTIAKSLSIPDLAIISDGEVTVKDDYEKSTSNTSFTVPFTNSFNIDSSTEDVSKLMFYSNGNNRTNSSNYNLTIEHPSLQGNDAATVWDRLVDEVVLMIQPQEAQLAYRTSVTLFISKHSHTTLGSHIYGIGLHGLNCFLPDDPICLSVFLNKNQESTWYVKLNEKLCRLAGGIPDTLDVLDITADSNNSFHGVDINNNNEQYKHFLTNVSFQNNFDIGHKLQCLVDSVVGVEVVANERIDLCLVGFFEDFDRLIGNDHLFKRSILLIRSWWLYESNLSSELISDNTICIMICALFNQYSTKIHFPLQTLCIFLDEYSSIDFSQNVITLFGIIPYNKFKDMTVDMIAYSNDYIINQELVDKYQNYINAIDVTEENSAANIKKLCVNKMQKSSFMVVHPFSYSYVNMIQDGNSRLNSQDSKLIHDNSNIDKKIKKIVDAVSIGSKSLNNILNSGSTSAHHAIETFFKNTMARFGRGWRPDAPGSCDVLNQPYSNSKDLLFKRSGDHIFADDINSIPRANSTEIYTPRTDSRNTSSDVITPTLDNIISRTHSNNKLGIVNEDDDIINGTSFLDTSIFRNQTSVDSVNNLSNERLLFSSNGESASTLFGNLPVNDITDCLIINIEKVYHRIRYCNLLLESQISESALRTLTFEILNDKGPLPVGEIGKMLQESASSSSSMSSLLKEKFGGLKKFLELYPDDFLMSTDHPFNPHVYLRKSLKQGDLMAILRGESLVKQSSSSFKLKKQSKNINVRNNIRNKKMLNTPPLERSGSDGSRTGEYYNNSALQRNMSSDNIMGGGARDNRRNSDSYIGVFLSNY
jgi:hypothetical protein